MMKSKAASACVAVVFVLFLSASSASALPNYYWTVEGTRITSNVEVKLEKAAGSVFKLRTTVLGGSGVVECETVGINHGVIFNGRNGNVNEAIGRGEGEIELTKCKTSICLKVKEPIKMLPTGVAQAVNLADKNGAGETTKVYDALLPNNAKEFSSITLEGGLCGTSTTFKATTPLTRGAYENALEGEAGLLGEIDKTKAAAETSSTSHELSYVCSGTSQEPKKAFNGEGKEVSVDSLQVILGETNSACIEGKATLKLVNGKTFAVK